MTKAEAREFAERWRKVNLAEVEELRSTPLEVQLRQLDSLRTAFEAFGWEEDPKEVEEVRDRWNRLRSLALG
ncbi:hypothetical protein EHM82_04595 [bacterium]|nr:MAG: hypothetical protein EHM82_04595 [bacterium]